MSNFKYLNMLKFNDICKYCANIFHNLVCKDAKEHPYRTYKTITAYKL